MAGYVYLMRMGEFHKIGQTIDVKGRLMTLDVGPTPLRLIHSFASPSAWADEQELHRRHAAKRIRREWFRLDDADVDEFRRIERGPPPTPANPLLAVPLPVLPPAPLPGRLRHREKIRLARQRFGQYAAALLVRAGLTPVDLASAARVPLPTIERWMDGYSLGGFQCGRVAVALGVPAEPLRLANVRASYGDLDCVPAE